jgi:hypothetical protein
MRIGHKKFSVDRAHEESNTGSRLQIAVIRVDQIATSVKLVNVAKSNLVRGNPLCGRCATQPPGKPQMTDHF